MATRYHAACYASCLAALPRLPLVEISVLCVPRYAVVTFERFTHARHLFAMMLTSAAYTPRLPRNLPRRHIAFDVYA